MHPKENLDLNDLPLDAFELSGQFDVEHLTAGHGLTEVGAFCNSCCCCCHLCWG